MGMNLRQLKEEINKIPDEFLDYAVVTEGCDCNGDVASIGVDTNLKEVYLARVNEYKIIGEVPEPFDPVAYREREEAWLREQAERREREEREARERFEEESRPFKERGLWPE